MKQVLATIFALALCLSVLTSCGNSSSSTSSPDSSNTEPSSNTATGQTTSTAPEGKTDLIVGGYADTTSFDPLVEGANTVTMIGLCVFDNLFTMNADGSYNYQLAKSAEWVEDNGEWSIVITIRDDVYFHSGDKLTCEDVLFTMMRMCGSMMYGSRVENANFDAAVIDGNTLTIPMYQYDARFLPNMTSELGYIQNKSYFEEVGAEEAFRAPDGTGPYIFNDWVANEFVTLTRNDNYWGDVGAFETIVYKFFSDDNTRVLEFEAGNLDICVATSAENVNSIAAGDYEGCYMYSWDTNKQGMLFFNNSTESSPFYGNRALRKAISYAIDVDAIVTSIGGSTTIAATSSLPSGCSHYVPYEHVYDVELAKQYLAEAGYADGFEFSIMVASDQGSNERIAVAIQAYLKQIGITMNIESMDLFTLMGYQMSGEQLCGIVDNTIRGDDYEMYQGTVEGSGNMLCEIHDDSFQGLLNTILSENDQNSRSAEFQQLQEMISEEDFFIPLYQNVGNWAYHDYVVGMGESAVLGAESLVDLAALSFAK